MGRKGLRNQYLHWPMTSEAKKDRDTQVQEWGSRLVSTNLCSEILQVGPGVQANLGELQSDMHSVHYARTTTSKMTPMGAQRYFGHLTGEFDMRKNPMTVELETYISYLHNLSVVQNVYVTADERDEESKEISILIKLKQLSNMDPAELDAKNKHLTDFLNVTKIEGADRVRVSFQYTEVYGE